MSFLAGSGRQVRTVDLDIDIGAEAVDYKWVPTVPSHASDSYTNLVSILACI
jgi:hypothetical protein